MRRLLPLLVVALLIAAGCGSDDAADEPTTSTTTSTLAPSTPAAPGVDLTAEELEQLVVGPDAPFTQMDDASLDTGLMEIGNPASGKIGIGFAAEEEMEAAGLSRGWVKAFNAADGESTLLGHVFQFDTEAGAQEILDRFLATDAPGIEFFDLPDGIDGSGVEGTSPDGRTTVVTEAVQGRFLVGFLAGGTSTTIDYKAVAIALTEEQLAALP